MIPLFKWCHQVSSFIQSRPDTVSDAEAWEPTAHARLGPAKLHAVVELWRQRPGITMEFGAKGFWALGSGAIAWRLSK